MNKLQQLEAKIQEAVPEIMELKFGCRVLLENDVKRTILKDNNGKGYYFSVLENDLTLIREGIEEILGRPITLLDTKQCLEYNKCTDKDFLEVANLWKSPNSLSNQSQELIDKLYEKIKS